MAIHTKVFDNFWNDLTRQLNILSLDTETGEALCQHGLKHNPPFALYTTILGNITIKIS